MIYSVQRIDQPRFTSRAQQGFVIDRRWQVVDSSGHSVSSRTYSRRVDAIDAARFHTIRARRR